MARQSLTGLGSHVCPAGLSVLQLIGSLGWVGWVIGCLAGLGLSGLGWVWSLSTRLGWVVVCLGQGWAGPMGWAFTVCLSTLSGLSVCPVIGSGSVRVIGSGSAGSGSGQVWPGCCLAMPHTLSGHCCPSGLSTGCPIHIVHTIRSGLSGSHNNTVHTIPIVQ